MSLLASRVRTGQWEELLPLCAFQGAFASLREFTARALTGADAKMVEELRWVLESRFQRASAVGARAIPSDWQVSMGSLFGANAIRPSPLELPPSSSCQLLGLNIASSCCGCLLTLLRLCDLTRSHTLDRIVTNLCSSIPAKCH